MVRIIDIEDSSASEVSDSNSEDDDEEDEVELEDDKAPDPEPDEPEPPSVPQALAGALAEPSAPAQEESPGPSAGPAPTEDERRRFISPILRLGLNQPHVLHLLNRYVNRVSAVLGNHPINSAGLSRLASELQQSAGSANPTNTQFTLNFVGPMTPSDEVTEDSGRTDQEVVSETSSDLSQNTENPDNSGYSTQEKSNGLGEKEQLAAAGGKASLDLSDCDISDVSDSIAPHTISPPLENQVEIPPIDSSWITELDSLGFDDIEPELAQLAAIEISEAFDEPGAGEAGETSAAGGSCAAGDAGAAITVGETGEASALPLAAARVKDSWEEWATDDRLFALVEPESEPSLATPSSSCARRAPVERIPSPTTEHRRVKLENRQRARDRGSVRTLTRNILVPTEKIGRIVGKGGKRISMIEKKSGAKIKIENRKSADPGTKITLTGTGDQIQAADDEICLIIRNFKPLEPGEPTNASVYGLNDDQLKKMLVSIKNQVLDGEKNCRLP